MCSREHDGAGAAADPRVAWPRGGNGGVRLMGISLIPQVSLGTSQVSPDTSPVSKPNITSIAGTSQVTPDTSQESSDTHRYQNLILQVLFGTSQVSPNTSQPDRNHLNPPVSYTDITSITWYLTSITWYLKISSSRLWLSLISTSSEYFFNKLTQKTIV